MNGFLARGEAPLTDSEWRAIDETVVGVAKRLLVARRVLRIFGPLGAGVQALDYDTFKGTARAAVDMYGRGEANAVEAEKRVHQDIPLIYKDFVLHWRDIETARKLGVSIDTSSAAAAAAFVAESEDDFIFNGLPDQGFPGLLNVEGRNTLAARDWAEVGAAFDDVVEAIQILTGSGFPGPFAVIVSPLRFSQMHRVYANSGVLEIEHVRKMAEAGVFQSPTIEDYGLVLSVGQQNADIALSQDLITGFLGPEDMNYPFRVMESLALRIKRPGAICTFEPTGKAPEKISQGRARKK